MNIREEIINIKDSIINWRRDFHQYPELAFSEYRTGDVIAKELRTMGLDPKENVGKTGVTADLKCGDGPVIAIRADMDALPIEETSGLDFSSKIGDAYLPFSRTKISKLKNFQGNVLGLCETPIEILRLNMKTEPCKSTLPEMSFYAKSTRIQKKYTARKGFMGAVQRGFGKGEINDKNKS